MKARLLVVALLLVAVGGYYLWEHLAHPPGAAIVTSGTIEATEVTLAPEVAGRVAQVPVAEGQGVRAGDVLLQIDTTALRLQLAQAQAALAAVQARLAEAKAGARPEQLAAAAQALAGAGASREQAARNLATQRALFAGGATTQAALDAAGTAVSAAEANLGQAQAGYDLLRSGPTPETLQTLQAAVQQAQAAADLAQWSLDRATLKAPLAATVLYRAVEPGELATPGASAFTLADLENLYIRVYVPEADLSRVRLGQAVKISIDGTPDKVYAGKVSEISHEAEFTPKNVQTKKERTAMVFALKVQVVEGLDVLKPGMPADVEFVES